MKEKKKYLIFTPPNHKIINPLKEINIDGLNFVDEAQKVSSNNDTRILWCVPKIGF